MQALMLAAGMGQRLGHFTEQNTKCMIEVAGRRLIDRAVEAVRLAGISRMVLVIGYQAENLRRYILDVHENSGIDFLFVENPDYARTNNVYSLFLARDFLEQDDTLLLESDLVFEPTLLRRVVENPAPNLAVVSEYESWMDGSMVSVDDLGNIVSFVAKEDVGPIPAPGLFKTVNIYKFSRKFSESVYLPFLEAYMRVYGLGNYYETVLKVVTYIAKTHLKAFFIGDLPWYEIDDAQDLDVANVLFSEGAQKYDNLTAKFGGYWRYPRILDFCYLVNPYFPPREMVERLRNELPSLLDSYPSGLNIQNMNAERIFNVDQQHMLVGNGAAELINSLAIWIGSGKVAVSLPTFNEYVRCFRKADLLRIDNSRWDFQHHFDTLRAFCGKVDYLIAVSPDNPSGCLLTREQVLSLADEGLRTNTRIVIDESFIDFADGEQRYTLFDNAILDAYPNLIVLKSISKSYGVPALRLGVLACSDQTIIAGLREILPVWNINSFAEYFLQIFNLFAKDYTRACDRIAAERNRFLAELGQFPSLRVYPSQANFIMIDLQGHSSREFCVRMLDHYGILVKDLSQKDYFAGRNFIRVAVRDSDDNNRFLEAMRREFKAR